MIVKDIRDNYMTLLAGTSTSAAFTNLLRDHTASIKTFHDLLEGLVDRQHDQHIQRAWKRLHAVQSKEAILEICNRLEQQKSSLAVFLNGTNL